MVWVSIMYHCLWCNGTRLVFVIFITLRFLVFWYNLFFIQRKRGSNLAQLKIEVKVYLLVCDWWKNFIVHKFFWQSWCCVDIFGIFLKTNMFVFDWIGYASTLVSYFLWILLPPAWKAFSISMTSSAAFLWADVRSIFSNN